MADAGDAAAAGGAAGDAGDGDAGRVLGRSEAESYQTTKVQVVDRLESSWTSEVSLAQWLTAEKLGQIRDLFTAKHGIAPLAPLTKARVLLSFLCLKPPIAPDVKEGMRDVIRAAVETSVVGDDQWVFVALTAITRVLPDLVKDDQRLTECAAKLEAVYNTAVNNVVHNIIKNWMQPEKFQRFQSQWEPTCVPLELPYLSKSLLPPMPRFPRHFNRPTAEYFKQGIVAAGAGAAAGMEARAGAGSGVGAGAGAGAGAGSGAAAGAGGGSSSVKAEAGAGGSAAQKKTTPKKATPKKTKKEAEEEFYTKPGQRHPTPSPGAGDRVFYETLLQQNPKSEMALIWCIEYGVLPLEVANDLFKSYLKLKGKKPGTSTKAPPAKRRAVSKKSNVVKESGVDVGMSVGGVETVGAMTM